MKKRPSPLERASSFFSTPCVRAGVQYGVRMTSSPGSRRVGWVLGAVYLIVLVAIASTPERLDERVYPALLRALQRMRRLGAPEWLTYTTVEFGANVLLFVPLGALVVLLLGPRRWPWAIVVGIAASGLIELAQGLFLSSRVSSLQDVVANGSGALLGAILTVAVLTVVRRRRRSRAPRASGDQPMV
jgi:glycopeptide antibiotics resistance protein